MRKNPMSLQEELKFICCCAQQLEYAHSEIPAEAHQIFTWNLIIYMLLFLIIVVIIII